MKRAVSTGLFLLLSATAPLLYADNNTENDNLSLEFLEFLGSFETENGQWIDPMEIEDMLKLSTQAQKTEEKNDE